MSVYSKRRVTKRLTKSGVTRPTAFETLMAARTMLREKRLEP